MKTALDYANETIKLYVENSAYNPENMHKFGLKQAYPKWEEKLEKEKLEIYLMTILERMPYDLLKKEDK
jgi:hypothetical protein